MNTKIVNFILFSCFAFISACETAYHPTGEYGGFPHGGYSSTTINSNTVIVNFDAALTPQSTINNYVLYRAAKITIESGYDYFVVVSTSTNHTNVHINEQITDVQTQPPKLFNSYYQDTQYQSYQTSKSKFHHCPCPSTYTLTDKLSSKRSTAVIKMYKGPIPPGMPNAYDPYDVITHVDGSQN